MYSIITSCEWDSKSLCSAVCVYIYIFVSIYVIAESCV